MVRPERTNRRTRRRTMTYRNGKRMRNDRRTLTGSKSFHRNEDPGKQNDPELAMMGTGQKVQSSTQSGTTMGPTAADRPEPPQKDSRPILDGPKVPSAAEATRPVERKIPNRSPVREAAHIHAGQGPGHRPLSHVRQGDTQGSIRMHQMRLEGRSVQVVTLPGPIPTHIFDQPFSCSASHFRPKKVVP